jgi:hypothetical protein
MQAMSTIRKDFLACHLRAQLGRLHSLLRNVEDDQRVDCAYTLESLKALEEDFRKLRRVCCAQ